MTFTLGIFDLFTYAIPGALHLAFLGYLGVRLGLVPADAADGVPGVVLLVGVAVASYLLGHLTYALGWFIDRASWWFTRDPRQAFRAHVPAARPRPYVDTTFPVLQAAIELRDREVAIELSRLRAVGLMVRNAGVPFAFAAAAALVEVAIGPSRGLAAACFLLFGLLTASSAYHCKRVRYWADLKILELGFWIPGIDQSGLGASDAAQRPRPVDDDAVRPPPDAPA